MPIAAKLLLLPPLGIALMILSFVWWWPLGLAILAFMIGSGRMACWHHNGTERWQSKLQRMQDKVERVREKMEKMHGGSGWWGSPPSSGNRAFDEYREETLRRLEEEQREFRDFLARLRFAKDKTEFDQFMAERRSRFQDSGPQPQT